MFDVLTISKYLIFLVAAMLIAPFAGPAMNAALASDWPLPSNSAQPWPLYPRADSDCRGRGVSHLDLPVERSNKFDGGGECSFYPD